MPFKNQLKRESSSPEPSCLYRTMEQSMNQSMTTSAPRIAAISTDTAVASIPESLPSAAKQPKACRTMLVQHSAIMKFQSIIDEAALRISNIDSMLLSSSASCIRFESYKIKTIQQQLAGICYDLEKSTQDRLNLYVYRHALILSQLYGEYEAQDNIYLPVMRQFIAQYGDTFTRAGDSPITVQAPVGVMPTSIQGSSMPTHHNQDAIYDNQANIEREELLVTANTIFDQTTFRDHKTPAQCILNSATKTINIL